MISVILTIIGLVAMFQEMYWWALLAFFLAVSIRGTLVVGFFVGLVLILSGCAQFTETKNIYIDNTAVNNYVGNPCAFYVGDHCIVMKKPTPRNPDYPK